MIARCPEKAEVVIELYGGVCLGEICHDPLEQLVVYGQADEQLELVVFAWTGQLQAGAD